MSSINLTSLEHMTRESLASTFTPSLPSSTAIIDVRDSDHVGGHIKGSTWVPSSTLDHKIPELIRTLKDKDTVVFHCALSQQRGPSAALRYMRERERLTDARTESREEVHEKGSGKKQKVYVLEGGFTMWQEKYGENESLTEGYHKDVWEFGTPNH
ncbi:Cdc25 family phosphatase-like protein Ibp1 [Decorospora gaudefroyi]|uniref:Cdc25 family phosphatase-like protein Ibp1 n=1 Tax=Decorospora gaudefroyi TaxID=184978 RepID=A0A6A5KCU7_9PLEO|nr:Cdc25 family phosphatase-like protein Ibp1 [Decorospora gaudefroyi]